MHHIHMSHTIHIKPAKQSYAQNRILRVLRDRVRNARRYAHDGHRSNLYSVHAEFFDLSDLIDHRESDLDLRFTVNPDGG